MKFSIKTLAAAVALAASATGANAAIDSGATGNGELFFSIWDSNGSYTRSLEISIDSFQSTLAAAGPLNLSWAADSTFTSFLNGDVGGTRAGALNWNIMAADSSGARRLLTTYTPPEPAVKKTNDVIRSAVTPVQTFINNVNPLLGTNDSVAVTSASNAWAGQATFSGNLNSLLNFSKEGTLANNTYSTGLGFMRIDAAATGIAASQYNEYYDNLVPVNAYLGANNTIHIQAVPVPEPETYAMLLAGLGMLGFMARRRLNNRV